MAEIGHTLQKLENAPGVETPDLEEMPDMALPRHSLGRQNCPPESPSPDRGLQGLILPAWQPNLIKMDAACPRGQEPWPAQMAGA